MQPPFPSMTATWHNQTYSAIDPTLPAHSAAGKTVLITGGGRGIGARITHSFAAAGASVIAITGRTQKNLSEVVSSINSSHPGVKMLTFAADVLDTAAISNAFARTKEASPNGQGIDILVHNAGYMAALATITSSETVDWWASIETNVRGSYTVSRAFLANLHPKSEANPAEPVLIAASTAGVCFFPPPPAFSSYGTSMVAKARFFESLAVEHPNVRVINFHPGAVETDMGKKAFDAGFKIPVDDVDLAADFSVWLASREAEFLKSKMVWCNWDIDELKSKKENILADSAFLNIGMNGWPYSSD